MTALQAVALASNSLALMITLSVGLLVIFERLAPQVAITLAAHRLDHDLNTARAYLQTVMIDSRAAVMIFDSAGRLCESDTAAQRVLRILVDDTTDSILVTRIVEHQDEHFTHALARWMADPGVYAIAGSRLSIYR